MTLQQWPASGGAPPASQVSLARHNKATLKSQLTLLPFMLPFHSLP